VSEFEMNPMEPIDGKPATRELRIEEANGSEPKANPASNPGSDYWRQQAMAAREQYEELAQYSGIIKALEDSPSLVDVLEREIARGATDSGSWDDPDEYWDKVDAQEKAEAQPKPSKQAPAEQGAVLEDNSEALNRKREEINTFLKVLASQGVPDYAMDKFLRFINNPSGVAIEDLWQVYNRVEEREVEPAKGEAEDLPPPPVSAVPGETERPRQETFKAPQGVVWAVNPNNPF